MAQKYKHIISEISGTKCLYSSEHQLSYKADTRDCLSDASASEGAQRLYSSGVEQWFCKPKVGGSNPSRGFVICTKTRDGLHSKHI